MPARSLPDRPSLEFDRNAAKDLHAAALDGNADALQRYVECHPRYRNAAPGPDALRLTDAHAVIAREYGFPSWPRWKQYVEDRQLEQSDRAAAMVGYVTSQQFRRGADILAADPDLARFDLYSACACGDVATVRQHIERDSAVATRAGGPNDWLPILYACYSRFLRRDADRAQGIRQVVRLLLDAGADPSSCYLIPHGDDGKLPQTCLFAAAGIANDVELTKMLLDAGADPYERAEGADAANEALYHAAEFADVTCLRLVLEAGCNPKEVSYCLSRALDFDNEAAAWLFLQHGADATQAIPHNHNRTHLHKAVINRRSEGTIRALLESGADPNAADTGGMTPYRFAVSLGYPEIAAILQEHGGDESQITEQDRAQGTFEAGSKPSAGQLGLVARRGDLDMMQRMLDAGAEVNRDDGFPPLHSACYAGQLEPARLLLDHGADLTSTNDYGGDALGVAIYGSLDCCHAEGGPAMLLEEEITHGDYPALVELLIERGAALPERIDGGSDAVQDVLRRHGVPDENQ